MAEIISRAHLQMLLSDHPVVWAWGAIQLITRPMELNHCIYIGTRDLYDKNRAHSLRVLDGYGGDIDDR